MSTEYWTISKSLCRCCHAEGNFKSLAEPCINIKQELRYADMIKDCFDINLEPMPGMLNEMTYTICDGCLTRLCDAVKFKSEVAACEKKFKELFEKIVIRVDSPILDLDIKVEHTASCSGEDDACLADGNDDNYDIPDFVCDEEGTKKKSKRLQTSSRKVKPLAKKKVGRPKKMQEEPLAADRVKGGVEQLTTDVRVKNEIPESCGDDNSLPDENSVDFDDLDNCGYDKEVNNSLLEERSRKGTKKVQSTSRKVKSQTKKKVGRPKKMKEEPLAEGDGDKRRDLATVTSSYYTLDRADDGSHIYTCTSCLKTYKTLTNMLQHYRHVHLHLRPKLHSCQYCEVRVPAYKRAFHLEKEHGIPAPTCGACGKKFAYPFQVLRHQKDDHMGEKKFECEICQMKFPSPRYLSDHVIKHTNIRVHKCEHCDKCFKWKKNLNVHVMMHLNKRTHVCSVCQEAFVQQSSLKYHITKRHPEMI